jgi:hypothetical protein
MMIKTLAALSLMMGFNALHAQTTPVQKGQENQNQTNQQLESAPGNRAVKQCQLTEEAAKASVGSVKKDPVCDSLELLAEEKLVMINPKENVKQSLDGKIACKRTAIYTIDYEPCERAVTYYNTVINAEAAMNLQQKVRTDIKNQNIQAQANQQVATGAAQTGMFDAAIESNKHQKNMQQEKMAGYGVAVGALVQAYMMIPEEKQAMAKCAKSLGCSSALKQYKGTILSNQDAKASLTLAIAEFTAKGVAAGIAMNQYNTAAKTVEQIKDATAETGEDIMMERCIFNPTDPACAKTPVKLTNPSSATGNFGFTGDGTGNTFEMNPISDTPAADGSVATDENSPVAGVNSPFVDDAKIAKDIINPAGAAQTTPTGGAGGGGTGGGAGGGGGGSASLGNDLNGVDKDGNKEASIKAGMMSGNYAATGGGGFKGVGGKGDSANPFASLFDAKSEGGGIEEDRSIASGDIDGASSGLFQKISNRYNQVHADKRIEAKNLE